MGCCRISSLRARVKALCCWGFKCEYQVIHDAPDTKKELYLSFHCVKKMAPKIPSLMRHRPYTHSVGLVFSIGLFAWHLIIFLHALHT